MEIIMHSHFSQDEKVINISKNKKTTSHQRTHSQLHMRTRTKKC